MYNILMLFIFLEPAPEIFLERLRLLFFFKRLWLQGAKNMRLRLSTPSPGLNFERFP